MVGHSARRPGEKGFTYSIRFHKYQTDSHPSLKRHLDQVGERAGRMRPVNDLRAAEMHLRGEEGGKAAVERGYVKAP